MPKNSPKPAPSHPRTPAVPAEVTLLATAGKVRLSDDNSLRDAVIAYEWSLAEAQRVEAEYAQAQQQLAAEWAPRMELPSVITPRPWRLRDFASACWDAITAYLVRHRKRLAPDGIAHIAGRTLPFRLNPPAVQIGPDAEADLREWKQQLPQRPFIKVEVSYDKRALLAAEKDAQQLPDGISVVRQERLELQS